MGEEFGAGFGDGDGFGEGQDAVDISVGDFFSALCTAVEGLGEHAREVPSTEQLFAMRELDAGPEACGK